MEVLSSRFIFYGVIKIQQGANGLYKLRLSTLESSRTLEIHLRDYGSIIHHQ